jgi:hypothetical protein
MRTNEDKTDAMVKATSINFCLDTVASDSSFCYSPFFRWVITNSNKRHIIIMSEPTKQ